MHSHYIGSTGFNAFSAFACAVMTMACGSLGGPGAPERSIVGTYSGSWHFGIYNPDTIARGDDPPNVTARGFINCPGELRITSQDDRSIRGDFSLSQPGPYTACVSQEPGFCRNELIVAFCRDVSGSLSGEAFSNGAPSAKTILFTFDMRIPDAPARAALSQFLGCTVVHEERNVFTGGVQEDVRASASREVTADCEGRAGLDRVDLSVRLEAARTH